MILRKVLAEAIRDARLREGISERQLAIRCELKTDFIKSIESGESDEPLHFYDRIFSALKHGNEYRFVKTDYSRFFEEQKTRR